ncbi:hypothetical protein BH10PSE18_BH10PSE18_15270 [soil metagenome]
MAFDLDPSPTFIATAGITVPGRPAQPLDLRFKHKDTKDFREFMSRKDQPDREMVAEIVDSVVEKPDGMSDAQFLDRLLAKYPAAALDIFLTYAKELGESRAKN